jgi:hypothetical protein
MYMRINRTDRDALYDGLMTDLTAIGGIFGHLHNDEPIRAKRLRRRFEVELRLLDDLGWEKEPEAECFELTMSAWELRPIVERVYWSAVSSLANNPDELVDEAVYVLRAATSACPEILARLAEDDLLDPEARQGVAVENTEPAPE